jgi:co-chaperonin GroES (HSP10)
MIKPLSDRILVKPIENSEFSKGGVYTGMPTTTFVANKDKTVQRTVGEVLAIGPGVWNKDKRRPPNTPIGSYVTFSDTCGKEIYLEGEMYLFIHESDVMGFVDKPVDVELLYRN